VAPSFSLLLIQFMHVSSRVFPTDFSVLFQGLLQSPSIFWPINTSDTFPRWHRHSVYCLFSYWTHFYALFPPNFCVRIFRLNSYLSSIRQVAPPLHNTYAAYTAFQVNFCAFLSFFKECTHTKLHVLYSGPARVVAVSSYFGLHFN